MIRESICAAIQDENYSINSLAAALDIQQASLQRFCQGKQGLQFNAVEKLCDYLNLTLKRAHAVEYEQ